MGIVYFDNSATTKMSEGAKKKMLDTATMHFGNPSSLHSIGLDAEKEISYARTVIAKSLGALRAGKNEIVFTSGGTESNNIAILGTVFSKKRKGNEKILTTEGEHASVEEPLAFLEKMGYNIVRVPTKNGELDLEFLRANADGAILATFMHVNNETGALYDLKKAFEIVKERSPEAVLHSDCVQSYLKVKFSIKSLGADLISVSGHKVNGPKGVGALYVSPEIIKAKKISPLFYGGGQAREVYHCAACCICGQYICGQRVCRFFNNLQGALCSTLQEDETLGEVDLATRREGLERVEYRTMSVWCK